MMNHRGLTLLEVLAATVLLSMMAAVCVPILTSAMVALRGDSSSIADTSDLAQLAELFINDPSQFGFKDKNAVLEHQQFTIVWPKQDSLRGKANADVAVRVLRAAQPDEVTHVWLIFTCQEQVLARWIALPKPKESQQ